MEDGVSKNEYDAHRDKCGKSFELIFKQLEQQNRALFGNKTYGGATDLWGITLSPSDVNASNFGVVFQAQENTATYNMVMYWDYCQITVYYTEAGAPYSQAHIIH